MNEKPEALRLADAIDYVDVPFGIRTAAELRRLHAENEALTAIRDRQASMLRRLEDREAELDAEIGHLRRENERLREELRQSSIDITRAENERLREALVMITKLPGFEPNQPYGEVVLAALRREET